MKATITIADRTFSTDLEGLSQFVQMLNAHDVEVVHAHHYLLAPLDGDETVQGECWCGDTRRFVTYLDGALSTSGSGPQAATARKRPKCDRCHRNHLPGKACTS